MDSQDPLYAWAKPTQSRKGRFAWQQCGCEADVADSAHSPKPFVNQIERDVKIAGFAGVSRQGLALPPNWGHQMRRNGAPVAVAEAWTESGKEKARRSALP
ncbi:hypothetical protein [Devosia beringensis]|uniref:hypothetical protein n=1 Tax=Devosia beringensis TaxID=2657486 RepID=UPI00186B95AF|nr:hypothetical protein [Devosia beringensis]